VKVATTLGKGVVQPGVVDSWVVLGGLVGAIFWNLLTWYFGLPVSSSHALIGRAIMGVGATHRLSAVRWGVARQIVWAWILTIPVAAGVSAIAYLVIRLFL
jgi:PiT family inorganic phosphate transporter